jgi:hypothetical protein
VADLDDMHDKHLENVLAFGADERYTYFITTACATEEVFGLKVGDEDWASFDDQETGRTGFPVWPHARLAAANVDEAWEDAEPAALPLAEWLEFCDELADRNDVIVLMLYPDGSFLRVEPGDLKHDLEEWDEQAYDPDSQPRY